MAPMRLIYPRNSYIRQRPSRIYGQHFARELTRDDWQCPEEIEEVTSPAGYYRPWKPFTTQGDRGSTVTCDEDNFRVDLDVQHFKPSEITVRTKGDGTITVEGKHEEQEDGHGCIARHFIRKYMLPDGHDVDQVQCELSSDGVLTITAPIHSDRKEEKEREVCIKTSDDGHDKKADIIVGEISKINIQEGEAPLAKLEDLSDDGSKRNDNCELKGGQEEEKEEIKGGDLQQQEENDKQETKGGDSQQDEDDDKEEIKGCVSQLEQIKEEDAYKGDFKCCVSQLQVEQQQEDDDKEEIKGCIQQQQEEGNDETDCFQQKEELQQEDVCGQLLEGEMQQIDLQKWEDVMNGNMQCCKRGDN